MYAEESHLDAISGLCDWRERHDLLNDLLTSCGLEKLWV